MSVRFENNYDLINKEIKSDIFRWTLLPLDMTNRIEIVKNECVASLSLPITASRGTPKTI